MILNGSQRGGAKDLALHLEKEENEHVEVHELRGFVSQNLMGALNEAYAVSQGTQCKQFLYSLSLNPPENENVSIETFEAAIEQVEEKLGLSGQPRAIVFHEKQGRRHAHAVWSRIDVAEMKAIELPFDHLKLRDVSREIFFKHGWTMPPGLVDSTERDPRSFTLAEWQKANRTGRHPGEIKGTIKDCWAISDSQASFTHALAGRGCILAKGDKRDFVAVDHFGEVWAIPRAIGLRVKDVRARITDSDCLPSVDEAKAQMARDMAENLERLQKQQSAAIAGRLALLEDRRKALVANHQRDRAALAEGQKQRWNAESIARQQRFNRGLRGLLDFMTGKRKKLRAQNEREALETWHRDRAENDALIFAQLDQRRELQRRFDRLRNYKLDQSRELKRDIDQYESMSEGLRKEFKRRRDQQSARPRRRARQRGHGPSNGLS